MTYPRFDGSPAPPPAAAPAPPAGPATCPEPHEVRTYEDLLSRGVSVVAAFHEKHPDAYASRMRDYEARLSTGRRVPQVKPR